jgi:hypothetical protein
VSRVDRRRSPTFPSSFLLALWFLLAWIFLVSRDTVVERALAALFMTVVAVWLARRGWLWLRGRHRSAD